MSEVIGRDGHSDGSGITTRLYVWYPDEMVSGKLPAWEDDPTIAAYLAEMRGPDNQYQLDVGRCHNPKLTGQVIVIARLANDVWFEPT